MRAMCMVHTYAGHGPATCRLSSTDISAVQVSSLYLASKYDVIVAYIMHSTAVSVTSESPWLAGWLAGRLNLAWQELG